MSIKKPTEFEPHKEKKQSRLELFGASLPKLRIPKTRDDMPLVTPTTVIADTVAQHIVTKKENVPTKLVAKLKKEHRKDKMKLHKRSMNQISEKKQVKKMKLMNVMKTPYPTIKGPIRFRKPEGLLFPTLNYTIFMCDECFKVTSVLKS